MYWAAWLVCAAVVIAARWVAGRWRSSKARAQATHANRAWPLDGGAALAWLKACCAVAEGRCTPQGPDGRAASLTVSAALHDPAGRVVVLGGRPGLRRSLASVYGCYVARFLHGGLRGVQCGAIDTPGSLVCVGTTQTAHGPALVMRATGPRGGGTFVFGTRGFAYTVAVTVDGAATTLSSRRFNRPAEPEFVQEGYPNCYHIGDECKSLDKYSLTIAPDGEVYVCYPHYEEYERLSSQMVRLGSPPAHSSRPPALKDCRINDVCASGDIVVSSVTLDVLWIEEPNRAMEYRATTCVIVERRSDGGFLNYFAQARASYDDSFDSAFANQVCFLADGRHIALAETLHDCVRVFDLRGTCVRRLAEGLFKPRSVACSTNDELVVADMVGISVFSPAGTRFAHIRIGAVTHVDVAVNGGALLTARCQDAVRIFFFS